MSFFCLIYLVSVNTVKAIMFANSAILNLFICFIYNVKTDHLETTLFFRCCNSCVFYFIFVVFPSQIKSKVSFSISLINCSGMTRTGSFVVLLCFSVSHEGEIFLC